MKKQGGTGRNGLVHLDPEKLQRQLVRLGLSRTELAFKAGMVRNTIVKAVRGDGVFPHTALQIATVLGFPDVAELLASPDGGERSGSAVAHSQLREWETERYLGPWLTASNGLQFRVCRMQHRFVENRSGRGKWYDLLHLCERDREQIRAHLVRHPTVCERIGRHPHVADNISATPIDNENAWWVVDRWVDGGLLDEMLRRQVYPRERLPRLMRELALGLEALHKAQVVFRELAPSRVILASDDGSAVLTDFELAKLLDSKPTVSADWPDDPFRAPEVEAGTADARSDLYSWARILLYAATGELPAKGDDADAMTGVGLPKAVWRVAVDCLAPSPSDRPKGARQLLQSVKRWSPN